MILGVSYYPEFYDKSQWDKDVKDIAEIGFNVVRMAEFSWCRLEPSENNFDFTWLDEIIAKFANYGIKTILGTPTGSPPQWIVKKFSDLAVTDINRDYNTISGGFGDYCKNHPQYREYSWKIVYQLANHYKDNENVIMYQIDNEFMGTPCYCDNCKNAYIKYVKENYKTIENYNKQMMLIFQGRELSSFNEIQLHGYKKMTVNPSVLVDYKKFISQTYYDYAKIQVDEIKKLCPNVMVTSNFCTLFQDFDHFKMAEMFDVGACDTYPKADGDECLRDSFKLDLTRALKKKNFWVLEQQCSPVAFREFNYTLEPLESRYYTYKSIAQGADAIVYFRWNSIHTGGERFGAGIIRHEKEKGRTYYEVKRICDEIKLLNNFLIDSRKPKAKVAIVYSNISNWILSEGRKISQEINYMPEMLKVYKALNDQNADIDFVTMNDDFSQYEVVIAPLLSCVTKDDAKHLEEYVANGGKCIFGFMSGMFDEYSHISDNYLQGELRNLLGIKVTEWAVPYQNENFNFTFGQNNYPAQIMNMVVECEKAQNLGNYNSGFYKNTPAITENTFGKGKAYYVATSSNTDFITTFVNSVVNLRNPINDVIVGENLDIKTREKGNEKLHIVMNIKNNDTQIELKKSFINALTGEELCGKVEMKAFDVILLKE